jgi:predicted DNA binding protein
MWVAKIKGNEQGTLMGSKAVKYDVNIFAFPLSYFYEKDWIIVHIAGTIIGSEEKIKKFVQELKKEKRTINFELNGNFFIGIIKEPEHMKLVYTKEIIHLAPALISDKGYETATLGCFKREPLVRIVNMLEKKYGGELISLENKKVKSISVMKVHPDLTEKQKQALGLAVKHGYYSVPRKISVEKLAEISGLSFSTFQVHLRKAEAKLIPYSFE